MGLISNDTMIFGSGAKNTGAHYYGPDDMAPGFGGYLEKFNDFDARSDRDFEGSRTFYNDRGTQGGGANSSIDDGDMPYREGYIGYVPTYTKAVIPLACLKQNGAGGISAFSYTSGTIEFVRNNGCCYKGGDVFDFKAQKNYNSTSYHYTEFHKASAISLCKFTWGGEPWFGVSVYSSVHGHYAYFRGLQYHQNFPYRFGDTLPDACYSTAHLDHYTPDPRGWYVPYQGTGGSHGTGSMHDEIYNSIVLI